MNEDEARAAAEAVERIEQAFDLVESCVLSDGKPWLVKALQGVRRRLLAGTPGDGRKRKGKQ